MKNQLFSAQREIIANFLRRTNPIFWIGHLLLAVLWYGMMRSYGIESLLRIAIVPTCYVLFMFSLPFIIVWLRTRVLVENHDMSTLIKIRLVGIMIVVISIGGVWHSENKQLFSPDDYIFRLDGYGIQPQSLTDWDMVTSYFNPPAVDSLLFYTQSKPYLSNGIGISDEFNFIKATPNGIQIATSSWDPNEFMPSSEQRVFTAKNAFHVLLLIGTIAGLFVFLGTRMILNPKKFTINELAKIK